MFPQHIQSRKKFLLLPLGIKDTECVYYFVQFSSGVFVLSEHEIHSPVGSFGLGIIRELREREREREPYGEECKADCRKI